jgi:serine/threonine-protein kinase
MPLGRGNEKVLNRANLAGTALAARYEILDIIGSGGSSALVLKARQPGLERLVAIKTLFPEALQPGELERFQAEARAISDVSHYNIVTVHDCGVTERGQPFMVMEYIQGESLREKMTREGQLPFATIVSILIQACRGLQEAHNKGIIHRDLKPENILLQERSERADWVKIVDFGIARLITSTSPRLTQSGALMGTPEYIAPERFRNSAADARADLYSLGVVLFEMLTNRGPYDADTLETVVLKALVEPIDPPSQHRKEIKPGSSFDRLVAKTTAKNPDERHQTATELRLELEQIYNELMLNRRT